MKSLPPEVERRRRLVTRTLPLTLIAVTAFAFGAAAGAPGSPQKEAAERFTAAWARGDFAAMYRELNTASRRSLSEADFTAAYREAAQTATLRELNPHSPDDTVTVDGQTVVPIGVEAVTAAFGKVGGSVLLPFSEGGIAWNPSLVFPGLARGERLASRIELAPRAPILAADGTPLARGPADAREHPIGSAAIDVTGEVGMATAGDLPALARNGFPPNTPVGVSGLERAFNARLAGKPGGSLLAVSRAAGSARILASAKPRRGAPLTTTINPALQAAAVSALAGRAGGIAVLDARTGSVRALAGQAFSAPQPPGSTFKIVTTVAALQRGVVSLADKFPILNGVDVGGRFIDNANGEYCGGTFRQAFAESCNADFVPLGPKIGGRDLVAIAQRFGFNAPPALYAPRVLAAANPPPPSIPREIGDELDLGVTAIGQGQVLATPLEMASVAQTISAGGVRQPTPLVLDRDLRPHAAPVRVISRRTAAQVTELMIAVVTSGTGTAAAIPQAQVAGKTGTAELGPAAGQQGARNPKQEVDAWFAAFAPATHAKLAIGVLLANAGAAGGEVAAPVAARV
ncbi:MAG TPA: penicillin-binding transpeptidase domain-containing protein, partial [Solirubrobacterales bacterium]|nr:penicillin-binding transpeptidase domain-containing protein [Solirubrobacterales bacterium]